ncbi:MAG: hypothetical protein P8Y53_20405, partial [Pseudolabrys sp.]
MIGLPLCDGGCIAALRRGPLFRAICFVSYANRSCGNEFPAAKKSARSGNRIVKLHVEMHAEGTAHSRPACP